MPEALVVARNVRWEMQMNQTVLQRTKKASGGTWESRFLHHPRSWLSSASTRHLTEGSVCTSYEIGLCSSHYIRFLLFLKKNKGGWGLGMRWHTQKSVSCAFGGKKCLPVFWGVITIIKSHTTRAQTMQRTVLIVFPTACKAEQDLANSDCSAKKKPQRQSFGLAL